MWLAMAVEEDEDVEEVDVKHELPALASSTSAAAFRATSTPRPAFDRPRAASASSDDSHHREQSYSTSRAEDPTLWALLVLLLSDSESAASASRRPSNTTAAAAACPHTSLKARLSYPRAAPFAEPRIDSTILTAACELATAMALSQTASASASARSRPAPPDPPTWGGAAFVPCVGPISALPALVTP